MEKILSNVDDMAIIYNAAKDVYEGKLKEKDALDMIKNKVNETKSYLRMYFNLYKSLRTAKCYKMDVSEAFTLFLLVKIYSDSGEKYFENALASVLGKYYYMESINNEKSGLFKVCEQAVIETGSNVKIEDINPVNYGESVENTIEKSHKEIDNQRRMDNDKISKEKEELFELNIQPAASILNVFSRLSYKIWYALAEFVDNSTQSYISHQEELNKDKNFEKLIVDVKYDAEKNTLRIADNAFGMEIERFKDAIILDSRNENQSGRNEFGMGLKTAASWFGNVWTVNSTQYGSRNRYITTVDIPKLKESNLNSIQIHREQTLEEMHGTEILIEKVTKKITAPRTIGKIRELLSSMYRRDINNRNIEIWFNGEPIYFDNYPILTNFRGKEWKKDLDFVVDFSGKEYRVTGFVAIMNPGSFPKSGFALFRQDRVIIGGTDSNYKPSQIFGQAQSQISLKLFGELNMNDFPVNQAKDGFIWDDGLEEAFIDKLKENIQEYVEIANLSKKQREDESQYSDELSEELHQNVEHTIKSAFFADENRGKKVELEVDKEQNSHSNLEKKEQSTDLDQYIEDFIDIETEEKMVGTERHYEVPLSVMTTVGFDVRWATGSKEYWIEYNEYESDKYKVTINIEHPFFMPFSKEEQFKSVLEKFALAFILSEKQAKYTSDCEGYIQVNVMKNYMNKYLKKMSEE